MTVSAILLALTTLIALVAAVVAVVAVRSVRELKQSLAAVQESPVVEVPTESASKSPVHVVSRVALRAPASTTETVRAPASTTEDVAALEPRVVQGRVIVPPTQAQVVRTALGRPGVRLSVFVHGLARALRAENRDRIVALMRREYRHRRSERLRAGRQAVRMARPTSAPSTERLHQRQLEPRPLSLTDRTIRS